MSAHDNYTGQSIQVLTDQQHVRMRTNVYLGSMNEATYSVPILTNSHSIEIVDMTFIPAVYKAVGEIIDNAVDEFAQLPTGRANILEINCDPTLGTYTIKDNGRGVPIDIHKSKKHTPEVVFGSLRSGRNFTDDKQFGVIGTNGVGAACTNFCSTTFSVEIIRDGKKYVQKFDKGASKVSKPVIVDHNSIVTGTSVSFELDRLVFPNVSLPSDLIRNKAIEIALLNDVTVIFNGEQFKFPNGLLEYVTAYCTKVKGLTVLPIKLDSPDATGTIYIIPNSHTGTDEIMMTWINSSYLYDGGKCNTQVINCLYDKITDLTARATKKLKVAINKNDVKNRLTVISHIQLKRPEYDSQAKTRLVGPDLRSVIIDGLGTISPRAWKTVDQWFASLVKSAQDRTDASATKQAEDQNEKLMKKRIPGLLDATSKDRLSCRLLVVEGDSAKSSICEARDPETTAALALTGKINNVYGCTTSEIVKMGKLTQLLASIGLVPGKPAIRENLNYGKIVISTDSDYDGDDIFTLLVNLFYYCWPELFDATQPPIVYRLVAPNICVVHKGKRHHFASVAEYSAVQHKYKNGEVHYYKGLGSMVSEDWELVLNNIDGMIPIKDDGNMKETLALLFNDDAEARRGWLAK